MNAFFFLLTLMYAFIGKPQIISQIISDNPATMKYRTELVGPHINTSSDGSVLWLSRVA